MRRDNEYDAKIDEVEEADSVVGGNGEGAWVEVTCTGLNWKVKHCLQPTLSQRYTEQGVNGEVWVQEYEDAIRG